MLSLILYCAIFYIYILSITEIEILKILLNTTTTIRSTLIIVYICFYDKAFAASPFRDTTASAASKVLFTMYHSRYCTSTTFVQRRVVDYAHYMHYYNDTFREYIKMVVNNIILLSYCRRIPSNQHCGGRSLHLLELCYGIQCGALSPSSV